MPKASPTFDLESYTPVAERIRLFYERFPAGRIVTELVSSEARDGATVITFRALAYRSAVDTLPAATGGRRSPQATAGISERRAGRCTGFARSSPRYAARRDNRAALRARLQSSALLRREGHVVNRKLVQRFYREEGLTVRRRRRKPVAVRRTPLAAPLGANEHWSWTLSRNALADGQKFRSLTLVDDFTRECPVIEVDVSLSGERVAQVLDRVAAQRGLPRGIVCDNGPEFAGHTLDDERQAVPEFRPTMRDSNAHSKLKRWLRGSNLSSSLVGVPDPGSRTSPSPQNRCQKPSLASARLGFVYSFQGVASRPHLSSNGRLSGMSAPG